MVDVPAWVVEAMRCAIAGRYPACWGGGACAGHLASECACREAAEAGLRGLVAAVPGVVMCFRVEERAEQERQSDVG